MVRITSKDRALTEDDFRRLLQVAKAHDDAGDPRDLLIVALAGLLGMRANEIASMRDSWIDWQHERINIPKQDEGFKAKTPRAARSIPFGQRPIVRDIVKRYFSLYKRFPLTRQGIHYRVVQLAREAGIKKKVTPHGLRATAAYQYAEAGLSGQALRQLMGWESLVTAEAYIEASGRAAELELEEKAGKLWG